MVIFQISRFRTALLILLLLAANSSIAADEVLKPFILAAVSDSGSSAETTLAIRKKLSAAYGAPAL
jgi:hypothetical protein